MATYTQEQRNTAFKQLPDATKDIIMSPELTTVFQNIMKQHNLRVDQAGALADEANLVMVGLEKPESFLNNLKQRSELTNLDLNLLVESLNERFFKPIRNAVIQKPAEGAAPVQQPSQTSTTAAPKPAARTLEQDILQKKLAGRTTATRQAPPAPQPQTQQPTQTPPPNKTYGGGDPYREPVE